MEYEIEIFWIFNARILLSRNTETNRREGADLASRRGNETIRFHPEYREPIVAGIEIEHREKTRGVP